MKILILTQYFPPETGAAQNRLFNLAKGLSQKGAEVTILTGMPNYPGMRIHDGYRGRLHVKEELSGLVIHRSWIYTGTSKRILPRLLNYFSFVLTSFFTGWFRTGHFDYIICESPPLFLGITAYILSVIKKAKLIFNVSDLWPESAVKLGLITNKFLLNLTTRLEEFLYRKSWLITGQTQGIVRDISSRFPGKDVYWLKNGASVAAEDLIFDDKSKWRSGNGFKETDFILVYAGIIGHAQGLQVILEAAEILKNETDIRFVLVGDGPVKDNLVKLSESMHLRNVSFFKTIPRKDLLGILHEADVAVVPLRKIDLFKGAIPSKIFETLFLKKPLLLGVEGEAKELFIDEGKAGLAFVPEDAGGLAAAALQYFHNPEMARQAGESGNIYIKKNFNWEDIIDRLWEKLQPGKI